MSQAVIVPIVIFVLTFVLRIPIALGMLAASSYYFLIMGMDLGLVADNVLSTLYVKYVIMAVPLFIFTAKIMNSGKVTEYMFTFANGLVGRLRGGLGHVNVVASIIFLSLIHI